MGKARVTSYEKRNKVLTNIGYVFGISSFVTGLTLLLCSIIASYFKGSPITRAESNTMSFRYLSLIFIIFGTVLVVALLYFSSKKVEVSEKNAQDRTVRSELKLDVVEQKEAEQAAKEQE